MSIDLRFLLQVVRIVEALEGKGLHMTLTQGEAQLGDYLQGVMHQVSRCPLQHSFMSCSCKTISTKVFRHGSCGLS
jgi:hypothetical protein